MKPENILDAIGEINLEAVQDAREYKPATVYAAPERIDPHAQDTRTYRQATVCAAPERIDPRAQDARAYKRSRYRKTVKWGTLAACSCLIFAVTLVTLHGVLDKGTKEPATSDDDNQIGIYSPRPAESDAFSSQPMESSTALSQPAESSTTSPQPTESDAASPQPAEPGTVQAADTRAETWLTAEELGITKQEGIVSGLFIPAFISYRGGFYGLVEGDQMDSLRFACSQGEDLFFNPHYTHTVYLVENHLHWIGICINGMQVYEKIFDVTFTVNATMYAIAYSAARDAGYKRGNVVLETDDYTVYEAVRLQEEPAQTKAYIVNILPILQRERPNLFDSSDSESGRDWTEQWQLALPLEPSN